MGTSSKAIRSQLEALALQQDGFFTAKQAVEAGYNDSVHPYHLRNGDWIRMYRGIYRLAAHVLPSWPELVIYSLWSRDRDVRSQGVYAGETALMIHGVLERRDEPLHMIVPKDFRKNCEIPSALVLIKQDLEAEDMEEKAGYRVLTLSKTLDGLKESTNPEIKRMVEKNYSGSSANRVGRQPSFDDMLKMGID